MAAASAYRVAQLESAEFRVLMSEIQSRRDSGELHPYMFVHWRMYDETPQVVRLCAEDGDGSKGSSETAKVIPTGA